MLTDDDGEGGHPPRIGAELGGKHAGFVDLGMFRDEDAARCGKVGMGQDLLGGCVFDLSDPRMTEPAIMRRLPVAACPIRPSSQAGTRRILAVAIYGNKSS